jgi:uncharacterized phage protein gp47/JayE
MALTTMACTVDENGISAPSFAEILAELQTRFRSIYGDDIYLGNDAADGQMLGVLAAAIDDANQATIAAYNNFSPQTAVGVGLSQVVKVNGLRRLVPSRSTVPVRIIGVAGTIITGGLLSDILSHQWLLANTTIPTSGEIIVTATCQTDGAIALASGTVMTILTPVPGWQSATTSAAATPGAPVETDAALRQRQSISTAQPAQTPLPAIVAAVANLAGVQRVRAYENDTNLVDGNGIPPHSISLVVKGGDAADVATTIAQKKAPGVGTYGTTTEIVLDDSGVPNTINFYYETDITAKVLVSVIALTGYVSTTGDAIKKSVSAYISDRRAGDTLYLNRLWPLVELTGTTAVSATGYEQSQLDAMAATYNVTTLAQARFDATVTGGAVTSGATTLTVTNASSFGVGKTLYALLDDSSLFSATISSIVSNTMTFSPAIPSGRNIPNGSIIYSNGDLSFNFYEAPICSISDVVIMVA